MLRHRNRIILLGIDIFLVNLSILLSLFVRFEGQLNDQFMQYFVVYRENFILITIIKILVFYYFKLYSSIWRYASINEMIKIVSASIVASALMISVLFLKQSVLPRSVYVIATLFDMMFIGGFRFSVRSISTMYFGIKKKGQVRKRIMVVGAGDAGAMIIREYKNHYSSTSTPVVVVDDDRAKQGQRISGVPVEGGREYIPELVKKYSIDEIVIAIPSASKVEISEIVRISKKSGAKLKILPGIYELIDGMVSVNSIREVQIEDLLGREEIKIDIDEVKENLRGKAIMVTGGGGSIGSELCRQIAIQRPSKIVMVDIYENTTYDVQNELKNTYKELNLKVYIASVRDKQRIGELIRRERPDIIFHAAAHKHVPLMEDSPKEAIKNNVFGTWNLARAAIESGVDRFVMISTDKAVNPTNIMGASKRLCEILVQSMNPLSNTEFVAVRFGNVLGSNGSVIPLFKKQIEAGGPVTVTHPDVIRYFMTIPEAVQLVLQAGAMAKGGEIFVLDMGEPVKIMDLAEDLIRLSGFEPFTEIPIDIVGLRPGEKLFEELLLDEEGILETKNNKIFVAKQSKIDYEKLSGELNRLYEVIISESDEKTKDYVKKLVPTYVETNENGVNPS
ncbi:polysaccharide biosynthesis protein [Gudongella sp. DL1XJH-153]|uniref:polysaccharide biosynthesis protein n=1 Tax=Gudongella sp. DL1XJH-153 TaxID=3409804 RepID=UPI003BB80820